MISVVSISGCSRASATTTRRGRFASENASTEDGAGGDQSTLDARRIHVEVSDRANGPRSQRAHSDAVGEKALDRDGRRELAPQIKEDNVGLDRRGIEAHARQRRESLGETSGVRVIVGQALDVMAER